MKQVKSPNTFSERHSAWLAQLEHTNLIVDMLELFDSACFYLVNSQQQVIYWSQGMEKLTGKKHDEMIGRNCLPDYVIDEATGNTMQELKLVTHNGQTIEAS